MIEFIFFASIFMTFFAYLGYPVTMYVLSLLHDSSVKRKEIFPAITLIITVHNEEKRLLKKLENTAQLEYPREKLQIIIASDGSTDRTNVIVEDYPEKIFYLLDIKQRNGKENAQKEAVKLANGDIIFFSDAATILDKDVLKKMVTNFADPRIGCVSSRDIIISEDGGSSGEGLYVTYEMWLRRLESKVYSVVGLSGSFFAARREVCEDFSAKMQSDFRTLLNSIKRGLRGVSDDEAIGYYQHAIKESQEFLRKVRTVLRGQTVFFNNLEFLNFFKYGIFSYEYFCHKLLRWLVPVFMILVLITNTLLITTSSFYIILFVLQIIFYLLGIITLKSKSRKSNIFLKIPEYFITVNFSILVAWMKMFKGERVVMWQPTNRE